MSNKHFENKSVNMYICAIQKVLSEDNVVDFFFIFDEGRKDPNTTMSGRVSARQRNVIQMAFRWRADDGPTLNAVLVAL